MPIEIMELVLRATVRDEPDNNPRQTGSGTGRGNHTAQQATTATGAGDQTVEQIVTEILKRQKER